MTPGSPSAFTARLLRWYDRSRRDLPWRVATSADGRPDPYHVLVSEAMLQQTQVATVIPYFSRFLARFATLADLASADEDEVLRLWQGLGYYSRARNLHATARQVVAELGGRLPAEPADLLKLPGIGRYTAGAIASIAFGRRAPLLDGNVIRVLCRLDGIEIDPRGVAGQALLWRRAEELVPARRPGDFNSALMELGATVCSPRSPDCPRCPVRVHCQARADGRQEQIPAPRPARPTPLHLRNVYCVESGQRWLIERRPAKGRWARLWQFVSREPVAAVDRTSAARLAGVSLLAAPREIGQVDHALTHRRYRFTVYFCRARAGACGVPPGDDRRWSTLDELDGYALPRPHLKIVELLRTLEQ